MEDLLTETDLERSDQELTDDIDTHTWIKEATFKEKLDFWITLSGIEVEDY